MKHIFLMLTLLWSSVTFAQQKEIRQAVISTTTTVIAPETQDLPAPPGTPGANEFFRNVGETKSVTYIKNDLVKTVIHNEAGTSTVIRDYNKKISTTLIEMMGKKTGFSITDEEQARMNAKRDSVMRSRGMDPAKIKKTADNIQLIYENKTTKIAGYDCKRVYALSTNPMGYKDTMAIWYSPDLKFTNVISTGGSVSFGGFAGKGFSLPLQGLEKIDGFIMGCEINLQLGRRINIEVNKIDFKQELADADFEIPKDFEMKPMTGMDGKLIRTGPTQQIKPTPY